nr:head-tail connector protein [Bacillus velezensis]
MTLEEIKHALRIDHNFDDDWIMELKGSAEDYIKDAVTLSPNRDAFFENNPRFNMAVKFLVGAWYEQTGILNGQSTTGNTVRRNKHYPTIQRSLYRCSLADSIPASLL